MIKMRSSNNLLSFTAIILMIIPLLFSCHAVERAAVSCPEFSKLNHKTRIIHMSNQNKFTLAGNKIKLKLNHASRITRSTSYPEQIIGISKNHFVKQLEASTADPIILQKISCDTIFMRSGNWMNVKITKIGLRKIMYSACDSLTSANSFISTKEVRSVKSASGKITYFGSDNTHIPPANNVPKVNEPLAIPGFLCTVMSFPFLVSPIWLFFLLTGFLLGEISYFRIKRHPDKFKGKAFAEFSIFIVMVLTGIVLLGLILIVSLNAAGANIL